MKKFLNFTLFFLIFFCIVKNLYSSDKLTKDEAVIVNILSKCPELCKLINSDNWLEDLSNPIIMNKEKIAEMQLIYEKILDTLWSLESALSLPRDLDVVKTLIQYFIVFAGNAKNSTFNYTNDNLFQTNPKNNSDRVLIWYSLVCCKQELINFETTDNPAIVKLRDEVGIPCPKGFIYLRYFNEKEFIPKEIRSSFENENTKAVSLFTRYIAILSKENLGITEKRLARHELPKTISHELVHAYIKSNLGLLNCKKLPVWFHEGCAIYFSGSGGKRSETEWRPNNYGSEYITYTVNDPKEYAEYKIIFNYLESKVGKENLYGLIKRAINGYTVNEIYKNISVDSYENLLKDATSWYKQRENIKMIIILFVLIFFLFVIPNLIHINEKSSRNNFTFYKS